MQNNIVEMHAIVQGRVQGVGFRATVQSLASRLGLKGTVCNLPDGNVEIYAQGSKNQLTHLLDDLQQRTFPNHINTISTDFYSPKQNFSSFTISYHSCD